MRTISLFILSILVQSVQSNLQHPINPNTVIPYKPALDEIISSSPLLSFHREIVQIPSISNDENSLGDFILDFLSTQNFTTEKQLVIPATTHQNEIFNIYAYTNGKRHADILLTSHIDTVPPYIPYSLHLPEDTSQTTTTPNSIPINRTNILISGRGTVDAKASIASQIFATLEILSENPNASIALLFDANEENSGLGMKHFSSSDLNPTPPYFHTVIFGEPTNNKLVAGHKGTLGFTVHGEGKTAHSGYPWLGKSAISALLPVLNKLDTLQDIPFEEGGLIRSRELGDSTLNIGVLEGGIARNVVPAKASADVVVRLAGGAPTDTRDIIERAVHGVTGYEDGVGKGNGNGHKSVWIEFGAGSEPQFFDTDVEGFEVVKVNYGTDAFSLKIGKAEHRVRRYLYGPGKFEVAHSSSEGVTVGEIEEAVRGYHRLISAALSR